MKKVSIIFILLTMFASRIVSAQNNSWTEIPGPPKTFLTAITKCAVIDGKIYTFLQDSIGHFSAYFSEDIGNSWTQFNLPQGIGCVYFLIPFKGRIYINGGGYIYSSNDNGATWIISRNAGNTESMSANGQFIYAYGYYPDTVGKYFAVRSADGINWDPMNIALGRFDGMGGYSFASGDTIGVEIRRAAQINQPAVTLLYQSYDNGDIWQKTDSIPSMDTWFGCAEHNGHYSIVGTDTPIVSYGYPRSWGDYNYTIEREGSCYGTLYFKNDNYTVVGYGIPYYYGSVIVNGDTANQTFLDDFLWGICCDNNICLVYGSGHLYLLDNPTGIQNKKISSLKVYPNPTKDVLNIDSSEKIEASIYNFEGQEFGQYLLKIGQNIVDTSDFPSGVYLIKTSNGKVMKVIKQ